MQLVQSWNIAAKADEWGDGGGAEKRPKLHCGANLFRLRCDYRRTVDEIYFDCGAFFDVLFWFFCQLALTLRNIF